MTEAVPLHAGEPAPFEKIRCGLGRFVFLHLRLPSLLAIALVPRDHPWRTLMESTNTDLHDLTEAALRPRDASGRPLIRVVRAGYSRKLALQVTLVYFLLDMTTRRVPGPISEVTNVEQTTRLFARLTAAFEAFLSAS